MVGVIVVVDVVVVDVKVVAVVIGLVALEEVVAGRISTPNKKSIILSIRVCFFVVVSLGGWVVGNVVVVGVFVVS